MNEIRVALYCLSLLIPQLATAETSNSWLVGIWQKTIDEDNSPDDVIKFNPDGTWVGYGPKCEEKLYKYFVHEGDVFFLIPIPKGPVSLVFRPNEQKTKLVFTSPRTMNNASYEKVKKPLCGG